MSDFHRKTRQLCAAIERTLSSSLACDVEEPALDDVMLDRVEAVDGAFVAVFTVHATTRTMAALAALQAHLDDAMPVFKEAMARELSRKRVPSVTCVLVPLVSGVDDHRSLDGVSDL